MTSKFQAAFDSFVNNQSAVEQAIDMATRASYNGSGATVELFDDGTYRVHYNGEIGNLYTSRGIMVAIPALAESDMAVIEDGEEVAPPYFDNAIEALTTNFEMIEA